MNNIKNLDQLEHIEREYQLAYDEAREKLEDIQRQIRAIKDNFQLTLELAQSYIYPLIGKIITFYDEGIQSYVYIIKLTSCEETKCGSACQINLNYEKGYLYKRDIKSINQLCQGDPGSIMLHRDNFSKVKLYSRSDIKSEIEKYVFKVLGDFNEFTK